MNVNYEAIRLANIKEYGEGTRHLAYLSDLYSTRTHFIFELLQNTEDAIARAGQRNQKGFARFRLYADRLELHHNGKPFDEKNIKGICGIGEGTKAGDFSQIGKFGVGFKAVYSYTLAPRIHSGLAHFEIRRFVEPHPVPECPETLEGDTTLIVLPFDAEDFSDGFRKRVPPEIAVDEIGRALKALHPRSLLFLRHIEEVSWDLPDGETGSIRRRSEVIPADQSSRVVNLFFGNQRERWIVFQRETPIEDFKQQMATVEVAFQMKGRSMVPAKNTELVVFFPTKVQTGLGFLMQGPFTTKVSRESVDEDEPRNRELIEAAAQLSANSLEKLKAFNRLNPLSFDALPLKRSDFPKESFFCPVYEAVRKALKNTPLIPVVGGSFVSGQETRLAGTAKLTELFSPEHLGRLFKQGPLFWVDPTVSDDFRTYLTGKRHPQDPSKWAQLPLVEGIRVDTSRVAALMTTDFFKDEHAHNPLWMLKFYEFVAGHYETFKDVPFIRLESGAYVAAGTLETPSAYLRPANTIQIDQQIFPLVCESLMVEPVVKLLKEKAKLIEPDKIQAIIRCLLPKYETGIHDFDSQRYAADLQEITSAHKDAPPTATLRLTAALKKVPFIASVPAGSPDGPVVWAKPGGIHFERTELLVHWFDGYPKDDAWFPHSLVPENLSTQIRSAIGLGSRTLEIQANSHPSWHRRHYHHSEGGFDAMSTLLGLEHSLVNPTPQRAQLLWNWMLENSGKLKGKERTSPNAQYPAHNTRHYDGFSVAGLLITQGKWLPNATGNSWHQPHQLELVDLPDGFEKDTPRAETLARIIQMKQPMDFAPFAQIIGLASADDASELAQLLKGRSIEELRTIFRDIEDPELPEHGVANPALRQARLREQQNNAPLSEESVMRERSIQPNLREETALARAYLRSLYTQANRVICQCCHGQMPFKVNDLDYFEAIQCIRKLDKIFYENRLALCPNCAAKYQHARQTKDGELRNRIVSHQAPDNAGSVEIPVTLAGIVWNLHFVGKHWFDLKTLLND
jgi:hypothetical protein